MTGEEFKIARLAAGLATQRSAADFLRSDLRTVQRWESGERTVPGPAETAILLLLQTVGMRGSEVVIGHRAEGRAR